MRQAGFIAGVLAVVLICALFVRSIVGPFYWLPNLGSQVFIRQRNAPRSIGLVSVGLAVVRGLDGAIYATSGILVTFLGVTLFYSTSGVGTPLSVILLTVGAISIGLVVFRTIDVWHALRHGDVLLVEVNQAEVSRARVYGSPWGDLTSGIAAKGTYAELQTGTPGTYYMQQRWAMALKPGDRMWVLR